MSNAVESEAMAASRIEQTDHRIMNHPSAIWRFSFRFWVLRIRLNTTSDRKTGRITLVRPKSPDAMACSTWPKAPWTRNHSDAQNSTARIAMMKHAMSRRYLRSMTAIADGSVSSMTLVSPERDLSAEPLPFDLPLDFGVEDAVRAITDMILPMGTAMARHFRVSPTDSRTVV